MKYSLEWHKMCLENWQNSLNGALAEEQRVHEINVRTGQKISVYAAQIERAEREGRTAFDRERFNLPRKKNAIESGREVHSSVVSRARVAGKE